MRTRLSPASFEPLRSAFAKPALRHLRRPADSTAPLVSLLVVEAATKLSEIVACSCEQLLARLANLSHDRIFPAFCFG
jgi:hypothetical protein